MWILIISKNVRCMMEDKRLYLTFTSNILHKMPSKFIKLVIFTLFLFTSHLLPVYAQSYPSPQGYVLDQTNTLSTEQEQNLENILKNFEDKTTNEIAIAILPSLNGESLEDYANKLFENWGIGQKDKDNGILILIIKDERKVRIEVGYGLEGSVNDAFAGDVIRQQITPNFKEEKYYEGLLSATSALITRIDENYSYENDLKKNIATENPFSWIGQNFESFFFFFFYCAAFIIPIIGSILGRSKSWWLGGILGLITGIIIAVIAQFTVSSNFLAFAICPLPLMFLGLLLDYILSKNYKKHNNSGWNNSNNGFFIGGTDWSSGSSSSSGGSFGGGSSGGGGASGGW